MIFLTIPILIYQLFFVALMVLANRIGPTVGLAALTASLLWTATHIFMPPLAVLQTAVIVTSWWLSRRRPATPSRQPPPQG